VGGVRKVHIETTALGRSIKNSKYRNPIQIASHQSKVNAMTRQELMAGSRIEKAYFGSLFLLSL